MSVDDRDIEQHSSVERKGSYTPRRITQFVILLLFIPILFCYDGQLHLRFIPVNTLGLSHAYGSSKAACPQPTTALIPQKNSEIHHNLAQHYRTKDFFDEAVQSISQAVRIPTESYDGMGPIGEDTRWDAFAPFHKYILQRFPEVHSTLKLTKVNTWGLVYEWAGSNTSLKQLLLVAHQDVVPVDPKTVDQWVHPPYSGFFDGERIWGRGSSDDKCGLIAVMTSVEHLIRQGFTPTRSIVLTFGFDEESGGNFGARHIVQHLLEQYGKDSFYMVVDEGGGFGLQYGSMVAMPNVGEKGWFDMRVSVETPGGHSSVPPSHTSIGMLSKIITTIEASPFPAQLSEQSPTYETIQCLAEHASRDVISWRLRKAIKRKHSLKKVLKLLTEELPSFETLLKTTIAVDQIGGGVKSNALPEGAWAIVDHRVNTDSSVAAVRSHYTKLLSPLADEFNLTLSAFDSKEDIFTEAKSYSSSGHLTLEDGSNPPTDPVPKAPTFGSTAWDVLAGTIMGTYETYRNSSVNGDSERILVIPSMSTGNTDVRFYTSLSPGIFRYIHKNSGDHSRLSGIHTVNESLDANALVEMVLFFTMLILNVDEVA